MEIKRELQERIVSSMEANKAVLIFGARRVGKTVLMNHIVKDFPGRHLMLNGEDFDTLRMFENRSIANYRELFGDIDLLAIDEAQNIPDIGSSIKLIVDEIPGIRVLAGGSSSFDLLNKVGEPLVGRATQYQLSPFSQKELMQAENAVEMRRNLETRLIYGSYPDVVKMNGSEKRIDYLREVVGSYLLKDILSIDGLRNSGKMSSLLRLLAFQVGSEVSYEELGKQLGLNKVTVEKYADLLEKVFVVYRLGSYSNNLRKEVTRPGKIYFCDNGVRNALIGAFQPLALRQDTGSLWENFIINEIRKNNLNDNLRKNLYFWRTYDGQEIDLIEEQLGRLTALEFKWKKNASCPKAFRKAYPDAEFHVISPDNYREHILVSKKPGRASSGD